MKNIIYGVGLSILTFILLLTTTTISGRMMRETELRETLANAVDNAVENAVETNTYQVDDRKKFVSDVMENLALQYHSKSEKVKIAVNSADCRKGTLFITATAYYKNPIGNIGSVEYSKKSIYSTEDTREDREYTIRYMLDENTVYREYKAKNKDDYPVPADPTEQGKIFNNWKDSTGNTFVKGNNFPASVKKSATYTAVFSDTAVPAQSLTLQGENTMTVGSRQSMNAVVLPDNATSRALKWSSSDPSILSVNSIGFVTAKKVGEADITVELADGSLPPATCHIRVTEVSEIVVDADGSFENGEDEKKITVTTKEGMPINADCSFASSNPDVMYVNPLGMMQPVTAGTAYIRVTHRESGACQNVPVMVVEASDSHSVYDQKPHSATVNCPGADITYETAEYGQSKEIPEFTDAGTYTVNYTVNFSTCREIKGSVQVIIEKAESHLSVSAAEDTLFYPEKKDYSYTTDEENEGNISVTTDEDQKCLYYTAENGKISVQTGTEEGDVQLNVVIPESKNYKMTQQTLLIHVKNGTMDIGVEVPKGGSYDGENHTIKVTPKPPCEDALVEYSLEEDGEYTPDPPECINAGSYTIYYRVTKPGYKPVTGSETVIIKKASGDLAFNCSEVALTEGESCILSVSKNPSGGKVTLKSDNSDIVSIKEIYETVKSDEVRDEETGEVILPASETRTLTGYCVKAEEGSHGFTMLKAVSEAGENYEGAECTIPVYVGQEAGVYGPDGRILVSWNDLASAGLDITKDYTAGSYRTDDTSICSILTALKDGTKILHEDSSLAGAEFAKIVVPATHARIGNYAFAGLTDTTEIVLLDGIEKIGDHTFADCTNLRNVEVPDSVTKTGTDALKGLNVPAAAEKKAADHTPEVLTMSENRVPLSAGRDNLLNQLISFYSFF